MTAIEVEISEKEQELSVLQEAQDAAMNSETVDETHLKNVKAKIELVTNRLAELTALAGQEQRIDAAKQVSIEAVNDMVIDGIPLIAFFPDEDSYHIVRSELENRLAAQAEDFQAIIADIQAENADKLRASEDRELQLKRQNDELQGLAEKAQEYKSKFIDADMAQKDAEKKRDAAFAQLEEIQIENEQLRVQLATISAPKKSTDEQEAERAEAMRKFKLSRTVYNVTPDNDINPKNYSGYLATTGEEITYNWMQKNAYTVIGESEVEQFRAENNIQAPKPEVKEEAPQFQIPSLPSLSDPWASGHTLDLALEGQDVERMDATEAKFAVIFSRLNDLENAVWGRNVG